MLFHISVPATPGADGLTELFVFDATFVFSDTALENRDPPCSDLTLLRLSAFIFAPLCCIRVLAFVFPAAPGEPALTCGGLPLLGGTDEYRDGRLTLLSVCAAVPAAPVV